MFASKFLPRARRGVAVIAVGLVVTLGVSCDDPSRILDIPDVRAIRVFMILDPDSTTQPILAQHVSGEALDNLRATVSQGAELVSAGASPGPGTYEEMGPCGARYGGWLVNSPRCVVVPFRPGVGRTYDVAVSADGRSTARATTTIPGDFRIVSHTVRGNPPGTGGLQVTWTKSVGVFRYVIAIRGVAVRNCPSDSDCHPRWFAVTEDTTISATVPGDRFEDASGPWYLDVYAMNEDLYTHFMTGASGTFFPVPPAQNVTDGLGVVGAWVRRSVPVN
ncbi:MAG TPA: hypothetical protein VIP11_09105 [Gemmatimonadaceae bacterium]